MGESAPVTRRERTSETADLDSGGLGLLRCDLSPG
jgi:hypothetical protein